MNISKKYNDMQVKFIRRLCKENQKLSKELETAKELRIRKNLKIEELEEELNKFKDLMNIDGE